MIPSNALVGLTSKTTGSTVMLTVDSVQEDGTVNLVYGDTVLTGIPCMAGAVVAAGDSVIVDQLPFGWVVRGRTGPVPVADAPDVVDVSWGQGVPAGGSWKKASQVWVRGNAVYAQLAEDDPTPPQNPKTEPETITNGGSAGYWRGSRRGSTPAQGMWPGGSSGSWAGAWFFGDRVTNAVGSGTVKDIQISVARTSKYHGSPRGVTPHLYLVPRGTTAGPPPNFYAKWNGPKLSLGERSGFVSLPQKWVTDLASGAAQGVGCDAGVGRDYLIFNSNVNLRIIFA